MRRVKKDERARVGVTLNGRRVAADAEPRMLLSDFIRHALGATGTHVGCEHGVCGACTVLIDGVATRACLTLAVQAEGRDIKTVESLAALGLEHDLAAEHRQRQRNFRARIGMGDRAAHRAFVAGLKMPDMRQRRGKERQLFRKLRPGE